MTTEKTTEQLEAEKAAALEAKAAAQKAKAEEKAALEAKKAEERKAKAEAKAKALEEGKAKRVAELEAKKQAKEAAKAQREADKVAKQAAKAAEAEAKKAAREAARMPKQNGVTRPKPNTLCGKAWAIFDEVSSQKGSPATIKESLEKAVEHNLNPGNVKAEYASWRKFHGITGRVVEAKAETEAAPTETATLEQAAQTA